MRGWLKLVLGLSAIALMTVLIWNLGGVALKMISAWQGEEGEHDPMFAEPFETVTRGPEETEETRIYQDNSANWNIPNHTPIDLTDADSGEQDGFSADAD